MDNEPDGQTRTDRRMAEGSNLHLSPHLQPSPEVPHWHPDMLIVWWYVVGLVLSFEVSCWFV